MRCLSLGRVVGVGIRIGFTAAAVIGLVVPSAHAATLTVNVAEDLIQTSGNCSLREAIQAANNDGTQVDACAQGSGDDVIVFDAAVEGETITLGTAGDNTYGPSAFAITSNIEINADGQNITIARDVATTRLRFFYVASTKKLKLTGLTLSGGMAKGGNGGNGARGGGGGGAGMGGAVFNAGTFEAVAVTFAGNHAEGGKAGGYTYDYWRPGSGGGGMGGDGGNFVGQVGGAGGAPEGGSGGTSCHGANGGTGGGGGGAYGTPAQCNGGLGGFGGGGGSGGNQSSGGGAGGYGGGSGARYGGWGLVASTFLGGAAGMDYNSSSYGYSAGGGAGMGGAIFNSSSGTVTLTQSTFSGNVALGGAGSTGLHIGGGGGAGAGTIYNYSGTVTIEASTFYSNTVTGGQGAPCSDGSYSGSVGGTGGDALGGGVFTHNGTVTIVNSTFSANKLQGGASGGGVNYCNGTNGTGGNARGAGVFNWDGSVTIKNSTLADGDMNGGAIGTGATAGGGTKGDARGGGVYNYQASGTASMTVTNSILSDNVGDEATHTNDDAYNNGGGTVTSSYNVIVNPGNLPAGTHNTNVDPSLPASLTGTPGYYALSVGSSAIEAGDCSGGTVTDDQRGVPRPLPALGACDIGSYEYGSLEITSATISGESSGAPGTHTFTVTFTPTILEYPVTVTWSVGGVPATPHTVTSGNTDTLNHNFTADGPVTIGVTASTGSGGTYVEKTATFIFDCIDPATPGIVVDTTLDAEVTDGHCSLREAIKAANTDQTVDTCVPSPGFDLIEFESPELDGAIIDLVAPDTAAGLPDSSYGPSAFIITSDIEIRGSSIAGIVLRRNAAQSFRHFLVHAGSIFTLTNVTLENGRAKGGNGGNEQTGGGGAAGVGGAIYNLGTTIIEDSTLSANEAKGGDGGSASESGGLSGGGGGGLAGDAGTAGAGGGPANDAWSCRGAGATASSPADVGEARCGGGGGSGNEDHLNKAGAAGGVLAGGGGGCMFVQFDSAEGQGGAGGYGGGGGGGNAGGTGGFLGGNGGRNFAAGGGGGAALGSAIFNDHAALYIKRTLFSGNTATGGAGGTSQVGPDTDSQSGDGGGGGSAAGVIYAYGAGVVSVSASTFANNTATGGTGGTCGVGYYAGDLGGAGGAALGAGVFNDGAALSIDNSTFSGNSVLGGTGGNRNGTHATGGAGGDARGGALVNWSGTATINNVTMSDSSLTAGVGGPGASAGTKSSGSVHNDTAATLALTNSILANSNASDELTSTGTASGANNIIETGSLPAGVTAAQVDPQLEPLDAKRGPTPVQRPIAGSPAIDNGTCAPPTDNHDQRGLERGVHGTGCDIGAVEWDPDGVYSVTLTGPASGGIDTDLTYTADAGTPAGGEHFTFTWTYTGAANATVHTPSSGGSDTLTVSWATPGPKTVTVVVTSDLALAYDSASGTKAVGITGPVLLANLGLTLNEGATATITQSLLEVTDTGATAANLTYTIVTAPAHGTLYRDDGGAAPVALGAGDTFTQQGVNDGDVTYAHDAGETTSDSFVFTVVDSAFVDLDATTFSITVTPVNDDPVLEHALPLTLSQGGSATITATHLLVSDAESSANEVTYTVTALPTHGALKLNTTTLTAGSATFTQKDINDGVLSYEHDDTETVTDGFTFTVADGSTGALGAHTLSIGITHVNHAPTITSSPVTAATQGASYSYQVTAEDRDTADTLSYALTTTIAGMTIDAATGLISWTPTGYAQVGELSVTVTVSDGQGGTASQSYVVSVGAGEGAPVANAGPDATYDPSRIELDGGASTGPAGQALGYLWMQTSGPEVQIANATSAVANFIGTAAGTYVFNLWASTATKVSSPDSVAITVRNVAPNADAGASQQVAVGATVQLDATESRDANGDALTYAWTQLLGPSQVTLTAAATARPTFVASAAGHYALQVSVADGVAAATTDTVDVWAFDSGTGANHPPLANAGYDSVVQSGAAITLDGGKSSDADGDTLSYAWTQLSGPTLTIDAASSASASVTPTTSGVCVFALVVSDGHVDSLPDTVQITVVDANGNLPPLADAGPAQTVTVGARVSLDGSGSSDADGDALTYAWTQTRGASMSVTGATTATPEFDAIAAGVLEFSLVVNDGQSASAASRVSVTVNPDGNKVPVASIHAPATAVVGDTITLDGSGSSDGDGDALTYRWHVLAGPPVILSDASAAAPTFVPSVAGIVTAALEVSDGKVWSAQAEAVLRVNAADNEIPMADAGADITTRVNNTVQLDASGSSDPEGKTLSYVWTQLRGRKVTLAQGTTAAPTFVADREGELEFSLIVNDGVFDSPSDSVRVTVAGTNTAPVAAVTVTPAAATKGDTVTLDASTSSDADSDTLTFSWTQTGGPTVSVSNAETATASFVAGDAGTYRFAVTVSDGFLSDTREVSVEVADDNPDNPDNPDDNPDDNPAEDPTEGCNCSADARTGSGGVSWTGSAPLLSLLVLGLLFALRRRRHQS